MKRGEVERVALDVIKRPDHHFSGVLLKLSQELVVQIALELFFEMFSDGHCAAFLRLPS